MRKKYFHTVGDRQWVFAAPVVRDDGSKGLFELYQVSSMAIKRHKKIMGDYHPFDPEWEQYGEQLRQERMQDSMRYRKQWATLYLSQGGLCAHCGCALTDERAGTTIICSTGCVEELTPCPTGSCFTRTAISKSTPLVLL